MSDRVSFIAEREVTTYKDGVFTKTKDHIIKEYVLTLYVNQQEFATFVCTPVHLQDFLYGFLASEGFIRSASQVEKINIDEEKGSAYIDLSTHPEREQNSFGKRWIGSCCGKSRLFYFENDMKTAKTIMKQQSFKAETCLHWMDRLQELSTEFKQTGGVHNAALCSEQGIELVRTDIGRHNALDKIFGAWLQAPFKLSDKALLFSGRVSSEVILKTAKIGVGLLISKSAPSELAIELAEELNITLIGFARHQRMNIYSHPNRVLV